MNERDWRGGIDDLANLANGKINSLGIDEDRPINVRLIRDYMQRGLLGDVDRNGREVEFGYEHLVRLAAVRLLLRDQWPLSKIREYFDLNSFTAIESLLPVQGNRALRSINRIKSELSASSVVTKSDPVLQSVARASHSRLELEELGIEADIRRSFKKLKQANGGKPLVEDLTLVVIEDWLQVLVQADHISKITGDDAERIGRLVTSALYSLKSRKRK